MIISEKDGDRICATAISSCSLKRERGVRDPGVGLSLHRRNVGRGEGTQR